MDHILLVEELPGGGQRSLVAANPFDLLDQCILLLGLLYQ